MSHYILLLRGGNEPYQDMSAEEIEAAIQRYRDWANQLRSENKLVDAIKLDSNGKTLVKKEQSIQVDGPFTETKETIGGYFTVIANSYTEAAGIAQQCPIFDEGGTVEIREIQN